MGEKKREKEKTGEEEFLRADWRPSGQAGWLTPPLAASG